MKRSSQLESGSLRMTGHFYGIRRRPKEVLWSADLAIRSIFWRSQRISILVNYPQTDRMVQRRRRGNPTGRSFVFGAHVLWSARIPDIVGIRRHLCRLVNHSTASILTVA